MQLLAKTRRLVTPPRPRQKLLPQWNFRRRQWRFRHRRPTSTAAQRAQDTDIDELEKLTDALDDAVRGGDVESIALAEFNFHRAFNRTTNRMKLSWFLLNAARYLPAHIYASDPQWGVEAVANHRRLVAAMRKRDVDEVVRLTRSQFDDGARRLTSLLDELGLWT